MTLAALGTLLAGCSSAGGAGSPAPSPAPALQLRLVTSSAFGACSAPALTSDGPASACDSAGTTTYELGASLGEITPSVVSAPTQGSGQTVDLELNASDTRTFGEATGAAAGQHLAVLLEGRVISAPLVADDLVTTNELTVSFGTPAEAAEFAAAFTP